MLKIISRLFLGLMLMGKTFTMDPPNNPDLDESILKTDTTHLAAIPGEIQSLSDVVHSDLLIRFSSFLNVSDTCSYLLTCKKINEQREPILLAQISNIYAARKLNFLDVFFPFFHPQWKPEQLPRALALKFHRCYFEASKLDIPTAEPLQVEDSATIHRKFQLMYSAACGGHKLAAEEAGTMLLNPLYNNIIPIVIKYTDLVPETQQWDICRLNQPKTTNPQLSQIMEKLEEDFSNNDSDYFTDEDKTFFLPLIQELEEITPTDETKAIGLFLTEILEHMQKGLPKDLFKPIKTIGFAKGLSRLTPLLEQLLSREDDEKTQSTINTTTSNDIPTFNGVLNAGFIEDFNETLQPLIYNITISFNPEHPNKKSKWLENKYTLEAQKAMKEYIDTKRVTILLGGKCCYIPSMIDTFYYKNDNKFHTICNQYCPSENKINAFLYYLMTTRNPVAIQFKKNCVVTA